VTEHVGRSSCLLRQYPRLDAPDPSGRQMLYWDGKNVSMSLHTYGRHINYTGRSEFDVGRKREKPYVLKVAVDEHARA
jgi:hypothetical protein